MHYMAYTPGSKTGARRFMTADDAQRYALSRSVAEQRIWLVFSYNSKSVVWSSVRGWLI